MSANRYSTSRSAVNRARAEGFHHAARAMGLAGSFASSRPAQRLRDKPTAMLATANAHRDQWTRERLVRACQDAYRNNILCRAFAHRDSEIVAGARPGLRLGSADEAWNRDTTRLLEDWFIHGFDHEGVLTFNQFARHAVKNEFTQGDGLVLLLASGACQWIDGVRIKNPANRQDTEDMVGGVALDSTGRVLGYEVAEWNAQGTMLGSKTTFVPAETAIYVGGSRGREPGQRRGEPVLSAVLPRMQDLDDWHIAVQKAAQVAALFSTFITRHHPETSVLDFGSADLNSEDGPGIERARAAGEIPMFPGMIMELEPGEGIQTTDPKQPTTGYEAKLWADLRLIAGDLGVPLELAFYHYTANYAASRSAIVSAWAGVRARQEWLADRVLTPIVRWKLANLIRTGAVPRVPGWKNVAWNLPGIPTLDLGYEIDAVSRGVAANVMTRGDAVARINNGMTFDEFTRARGAEIVVERRLGISTQQPSTVTLSVNRDARTEQETNP